MRIIICENYEEMSEKAAEFVKSQIMLKPASVIGLPTGSTPIGMYDKLSDLDIDFSEVTTFNLDEYYPIKKDNNQSYYYFMNKNLYSRVNLKKENVFIPSGEADDAQKECENYEKLIKERGGLDLQVLGIGQNGHIGFNEPSDSLDAFTHITSLTENTIDANSRFFEKREDVPTKALTMGIATIMKAKKILLLASGNEKKAIVSALLKNKIDTEIPATVLSMHSDVTLICDRAAYIGL